MYYLKQYLIIAYINVHVSKKKNRIFIKIKEWEGKQEDCGEGCKVFEK